MGAGVLERGVAYGKEEEYTFKERKEWRGQEGAVDEG